MAQLVDSAGKVSVTRNVYLNQGGYTCYWYENITKYQQIWSSSVSANMAMIDYLATGI